MKPKFTVKVCARMMLFTAYQGTSKSAAQAHFDTAKNALVLGRGTGTVNIHETISPIQTERNGLLIPGPKLIGAVNVIDGAFNDETFSPAPDGREGMYSLFLTDPETGREGMLHGPDNWANCLRVIGSRDQTWYWLRGSDGKHYRADGTIVSQ